MDMTMPLGVKSTYGPGLGRGVAEEAERRAAGGWTMTPMRLLEVAFWIATEPQGYNGKG